MEPALGGVRAHDVAEHGFVGASSQTVRARAELGHLPTRERVQGVHLREDDRAVPHRGADHDETTGTEDGRELREVGEVRNDGFCTLGHANGSSKGRTHDEPVRRTDNPAPHSEKREESFPPGVEFGTAASNARDMFRSARGTPIALVLQDDDDPTEIDSQTGHAVVTGEPMKALRATDGSAGASHPVGLLAGIRPLEDATVEVLRVIEEEPPFSHSVRLLLPDRAEVGRSVKGSSTKLVRGSVSEALAEQAPCSVWIAASP